jgi:hypothetical protein
MALTKATCLRSWYLHFTDCQKQVVPLDINAVNAVSAAQRTMVRK